MSVLWKWVLWLNKLGEFYIKPTFFLQDLSEPTMCSSVLWIPKREDYSVQCSQMYLTAETTPPFPFPRKASRDQYAMKYILRNTLLDSSPHFTETVFTSAFCHAHCFYLLLSSLTPVELPVRDSHRMGGCMSTKLGGTVQLREQASHSAEFRYRCHHRTGPTTLVA